MRSAEGYIGKLKGILAGGNLGFETFKAATKISEDCCFCWYKNEEEVVGCLVFSNFSNFDEKVAVVHHLSTINPDLFLNMFKKVVEFLVRLEYFRVIIQYNPLKSSEFPHLFSNFQPDLGSFPTPWDSFPIKFLSFALKNSIKKPSALPSYMCSIKTENTLSLSKEPVNINNKIKPEMMLAGNRHCTLASILQAFTKSSSDFQLPQMPSVRLQRDILEILEIITSLNSSFYQI